MANMGNITSANASLVLTVETVIPVGVALEMFSTDQIFAQDELTVTEERMGVDGNLAVGWVPSVKSVTVNLEACSPSLAYMQMLQRAMDANRTIYNCTLVATIPSIRRIITWSNGTLKSTNAIPNPKRILDPTTWRFVFADMQVIEY